MLLRSSLLFTLLAGLALSACAGNRAGSPAAIPLPQAVPQRGSALELPKRTGKRYLFATTADTFGSLGLVAFALPLRNGEQPSINEHGLYQTVPVADDSRDLYVGEFSSGTIYVYPLPLKKRATAPGFAVPGDLFALALAGGNLYESSNTQVHQYALPLVAGQHPTATLDFADGGDDISLTTHDHTLYAASTVLGTVTAYHLPLTNGELPEFTIKTMALKDASTSIAVDAAGRNLYVGLSSYPFVYDYPLPYQQSETPLKLDLNGSDPQALTVGDHHLYVSVGPIRSYRLPLTSQSKPDATVDIYDYAAGMVLSP